MARTVKYVDGYKQGYITLVCKIPNTLARWEAACDCGRSFKLYASALSNPLKVACGECELSAKGTPTAFLDTSEYLVLGSALNSIIKATPKHKREKVKEILSKSCQLWGGERG